MKNIAENVPSIWNFVDQYNIPVGNPAGNFMFTVNAETLEQGVKYIQS